MNGLTQAELEDQRFCFAGENKINIQTNAFGFLGKGWRNLARFRLHATRFSVNAASVSSASARVANTRLYDAVQSELSMMVPTSIQQQTGVSSALHLLICRFPLYLHPGCQINDGDILRSRHSPLQSLMVRNMLSDRNHT